VTDQNYSHRSLAQKLGIKAGDKIIVLNPPENYLNLIRLNVKVSHQLQPNAQFIHYFANSKSELEKDFPQLKNHLSRNGMLWISNKKGDKNFAQEDVQKIGLKNGLVDIKIASVDETWSAMKFVYRVKDR